MDKGESTTVVRGHWGWHLAGYVGLGLLLVVTWVLFAVADPIPLRVMASMMVAYFAFWLILRSRTRVVLDGDRLEMHRAYSVFSIPLDKCAGLLVGSTLRLVTSDGRNYDTMLVAESSFSRGAERPSVQRGIAAMQSLAPLPMLTADDVAALRKAHGFRDGGKMISPYQRIRIEIVPWQWAALAVVAALLATIWITT